MWESSGIGSLDFVKKFFAIAPTKETQSGKVFFLFFINRCRRGVGVRTQDESPQVRLQALELISVILQLFHCDPPGVIIRIVHYTLLVQSL